MLAQKPIKFVFFMVLIVGFFPVIGWAGAGPSLLADEDMDGIYAKGIWVNFEINIALPGGGTLSVPSINLPEITMPNNTGGYPGGIESVTVTPTNSSGSTSSSTPVTPPPVASVAPTSSSTSVTPPPVASVVPASSSVQEASADYQYSSPGSGVFVADSAMQGNSGLIINAPNSAVSMTISVVVLNNSYVVGDILQSTKSYPTNLFLSFKSYMQ